MTTATITITAHRQRHYTPSLPQALDYRMSDAAPVAPTTTREARQRLFKINNSDADYLTGYLRILARVRNSELDANQS